MGVFPTPKRPSDHDVAKHSPWFASGMLGRPGLEERTDAKSNLYSRAWLFYRASAFYDTGIFPGRSEPRKRVWLGVPGVNNIRGGGHLTAINEQFAHKQ
jgi:hypothetical protein